MARFARLLPVVALLSLAACDDGLSPDSVNPAQLSAKMEGLASTFQDNGAFNSLLVLSAHFPTYGGLPLMAATLPLQGHQSRLSQFRRLAPVLASLSPDDIQALFPANVLGKTLSWNTTTGEYEVSSQTGAPATGVRILIYFIDTQTNGPALPLNQIGYVDLTDESTPQFDRLGVLLRLFGQTVADYDITQTLSTGFAELNATGRLHSADLQEFADFDMTLGASTAGDAFTVSEDITGNDGTHVFIGLTGDLTSEEFELRVGSGSNELTLLSETADNVITGSVLYNGTTVGTISGNPDDPTFTGVGGRTLSDDDRNALGQILFQAIVFAFFLSIGIFGPGAVVF